MPRMSISPEMALDIQDSFRDPNLASLMVRHPYICPESLFQAWFTGERPLPGGTVMDEKDTSEVPEETWLTAKVEILHP